MNIYLKKILKIGYTQNNTFNQFGTILGIVSGIENEYTKPGAQNLSKSIGTIFEGKIIGYNGQPDDDNDKKNWYQESYIKARFKSLTNLDRELEDKSGKDGIRGDKVTGDILLYSEYMQFKKAKFECYNVEYDDTSQRVKLMEFRYTGDDLE